MANTARGGRRSSRPACPPMRHRKAGVARGKLEDAGAKCGSGFPPAREAVDRLSGDHRRRSTRWASASSRPRSHDRAGAGLLHRAPCSSCSTPRVELRAICGGGRYDDLLQSLGGVDLPALGFGMGDVVLAELLRDRGLVPDCRVERRRLPRGDHGGRPAARARARRHELRDAGLRVEYALSAQPVGKQLKLADCRGAPGWRS